MSMHINTCYASSESSQEVIIIFQKSKQKRVCRFQHFAVHRKELPLISERESKFFHEAKLICSVCHHFWWWATHTALSFIRHLYLPNKQVNLKWVYAVAEPSSIHWINETLLASSKKRETYVLSRKEAWERWCISITRTQFPRLSSRLSPTFSKPRGKYPLLTHILF